jgi:uncharacterized membrane protein HdeD (DUF308 family)
VFAAQFILDIDAYQRTRGALERACRHATRDKEPSMSTATMNSNSPSSDDVASNDMKSILAQYWWLIALRGVLGIVFGIIALVMPVATILALVILFSAYMLVDGGFALYAAYQAGRQKKRWGLLVLQGLANIATAALAFLWPGLTVLAFIILLAAWTIVSGCLQLAAAFRVEQGRWWLVLGGASSLIFGMLLIAAPFIGAVVLTWWIGAWAIVFGAFLLVAAFRLRSPRGRNPSVGTVRPAT